MWALGVVIYNMLIGKSPFEGQDLNEVYKNIKRNSFSFPDDVVVSYYARDLI